MRNLEIKVQVSDLAKIQQLLHESEYRGVLVQVDTYYLVGERRLKIREESGKRELIWYARKMQGGTRSSTFYRTPLPRSLLPFSKTILRMLLGTKQIVEKRRLLYIIDNTRVHLDTVTNLGQYVELETVVSDESKSAEYLDEHQCIMARLGLTEFPSIAGSYSDVINGRHGNRME